MSPRRHQSGLLPSVRPVALSDEREAFSCEVSVAVRAGSSGDVRSLSHATTIGTPRKCTRVEGGALLAAALAATIDLLGVNDIDVAYWCDVDRRTVHRWLNETTAVAVERIVMSPRLWPTFDRELNRLRDKAGLARRTA